MSKPKRAEPVFLTVLEPQEIAAEADKIRAEWPDWGWVNVEPGKPLVEIPVDKPVLRRWYAPVSLADFIVSAH